MDFLFYDLETTGVSKAHDQVLQFAAIRCDQNLNQVETPSNLFCKPRNDVFPSPSAILANRLDFRKCKREGLSEFEFALAAHDVLRRPNTFIAGYNSKKFDDELMRFLFYRNLIDPYKWGYERENKRIDVMDQILLAHVFNREVGLEFPVVDGQVSLKLEHIAEDNHFDARNHHDALNDATNTRSIMEIIRNQRPKLFEYALQRVNEEENRKLITESELFCHVSTIYGYANNCVSIQRFLCFHPIIRKRLLTWNLTYDPLELLKRSPQEIAQNLYLNKEQKAFEIGFGEITLNQTPMVLKYSLNQSNLEVEKEKIQDNLEKLRGVEQQLSDLAEATYQIKDPPQVQDVDASLYDSAFFPDRNNNIRLIDEVIQNPMDFDHREIQNKRYSELLLRLQGRNHYEQLSPQNQDEYNRYRREKLLSEEKKDWMTHEQFKNELGDLKRTQRLSSEQEVLLSHLIDHVEQIVAEIT